MSQRRFCDDRNADFVMLIRQKCRFCDAHTQSNEEKMRSLRSKIKFKKNQVNHLIADDSSKFSSQSSSFRVSIIQTQSQCRRYRPCRHRRLPSSLPSSPKPKLKQITSYISRARWPVTIRSSTRPTCVISLLTISLNQLLFVALSPGVLLLRFKCLPRCSWTDQY